MVIYRYFKGGCLRGVIVKSVLQLYHPTWVGLGVYIIPPFTAFKLSYLQKDNAKPLEHARPLGGVAIGWTEPFN